MTDKELRPMIREQLAAQHPGALLVEELLLLRERRADLSVMNDRLWGYEIKSERDRLTRLPDQVVAYDAMFDYSTAIVADKFVKRVKEILPRHWGVQRITSNDGEVLLEPIRAPRLNRHIDPQARIWLLWKPEAIKILRASGSRTPATVSILKIWEELKTLPGDVLYESIRAAFTARKQLAGHVTL